ncbi:MAG TPA: type IV secretory system conjugative DNA transfer family protein [Gemmataceae bacterium]|nr:type IV secretory system conjugative DNA transfer family protein [Gemmataceae bacterium]
MKEILFILDESGQLGHMPAIDQGLTLLRSYGLRMAFFFQSIGQLHETFKGKEAVLLDNTEQIYFGLQNYETCERVSKMLGAKTITTESANENSGSSYSPNQIGGRDKSTSYSFTRNQQEIGRPLLMPDEVLRLHGEYLIAFLRNMPPILCRRVMWWELAQARMPLLWWVMVVAVVAGMVWALWQ